MSTQRVTIPIGGFSCSVGGALTPERALRGAPGVVRTYVNPATEMTYVEYDPTKTAPPALVTAIEHAGFRPDAPVVR